MKHQFGGCDRLLNQYRTIGAELLKFEACGGVCAVVTEKMVEEFRTGVSFIPVEVLESYLEDLLNAAISVESLFLAREEKTSAMSVQRILFFLFLVLLALGAWYVASYYGRLLVSVVAVLLCVMGMALYWHFSLRYSLRRMRFARLLSYEITRRRGNVKDDRPLSGNRFSWHHLFSGKTAPYGSSRVNISTS